MKPTKKKRAKRVRRTPEDARREILDSAERELSEHGPAAIRLQRIAERAGMSHPTVLHYFGSREALVEAVVERAIERLEHDLVGAIDTASAPTQRLGKDLIRRAFDVLVDSGHARLATWLLLSGRPQLLTHGRIRTIAQAANAMRSDAGSKESLEDTTFRVTLLALAIFGEGAAGEAIRKSAGLDEPDAEERFRDWLVRLMLMRTLV